MYRMDERMDYTTYGGLGLDWLAASLCFLRCECFCSIAMVWWGRRGKSRERGTGIGLDRKEERKGPRLHEYFTSFDTFLLVVYILFCYPNVSITGIAIGRETRYIKFVYCIVSSLWLVLCLILLHSILSFRLVGVYLPSFFFSARKLCLLCCRVGVGMLMRDMVLVVVGVEHDW